jgi:hypothetical protein
MSASPRLSALSVLARLSTLSVLTRLSALLGLSPIFPLNVKSLLGDAARTLGYCPHGLVQTPHTLIERLSGGNYHGVCDSARHSSSFTNSHYTK